jgi:hypothetical protein
MALHLPHHFQHVPFDWASQVNNHPNMLLDDIDLEHSLLPSALLTIHVLQKVKRGIPNCGKVTQMWCLHTMGPWHWFPKHVASAESLLERLEIISNQQFMSAILGYEERGYTAYDQSLREQYEKLREEILQLSEELKEFQTIYDQEDSAESPRA